MVLRIMLVIIGLLVAQPLVAQELPKGMFKIGEAAFAVTDPNTVVTPRDYLKDYWPAIHKAALDKGLTEERNQAAFVGAFLAHNGLERTHREGALVQRLAEYGIWAPGYPKQEAARLVAPASAAPRATATGGDNKLEATLRGLQARLAELAARPVGLTREDVLGLVQREVEGIEFPATLTPDEVAARIEKAVEGIEFPETLTPDEAAELVRTTLDARFTELLTQHDVVTDDTLANKGFLTWDSLGGTAQVPFVGETPVVVLVVGGIVFILVGGVLWAIRRSGKTTETATAAQRAADTAIEIATDAKAYAESTVAAMLGRYVFDRAVPTASELQRLEVGGSLPIRARLDEDGSSYMTIRFVRLDGGKYEVLGLGTRPQVVCKNASRALVAFVNAANRGLLVGEEGNVVPISRAA